MMNNFFIPPDMLLSEAMERLNLVKGLGLVVVNEQKELLGTLTDGDLRRALANGHMLNTKISMFYHRDPFYVEELSLIHI